MSRVKLACRPAVLVRGACCGILTAILLSAIGAAKAQPINLDVDALGLSRDGTTDTEPEQVHIDRFRGLVAFTLSTRARNITLRNSGHIEWGFPVKETATTPWVVANGGVFSGGSEGLDHAHDHILPAIPTPAPAAGPDATDHAYGPHPHLQMFLYKQSGGSGALQVIGCSDLKHTFATADAAGPHAHYLVAPNPAGIGNIGEVDTYSNTSNMDRNFLGPVREMNFTSFAVPAHDHFGTFTGMTEITGNGNAFAVYERDHGEKDHTDPFEHRLQAAVAELLPSGLGGVNPAGTRWFFAASYFVNDPATGDREESVTDNTVFRQFDPGWNGSDFEPRWVQTMVDPIFGLPPQDSVRWNGADGFFPIDASGFFVEPHDHTNCVVLPPNPGDYNNNGFADAGDYTIWRDTLGSTTELAADGDGSGTVDAGDYDVWKMNFGAAVSGRAAATADVPEPSMTWFLMMLLPLSIISRVTFRSAM